MMGEILKSDRMFTDSMPVRNRYISPFRGRWESRREIT